MELFVVMLTIASLGSLSVAQYAGGYDDPKLVPVNGCLSGKRFYSPGQRINDLISCEDQCRCDLISENEYEIICRSRRVCPFVDSRCVQPIVDECGCSHCDIRFDSYVNFNTDKFYQFVYYQNQLETEGGIFLNFRVNTKRDAYIALSPEPQDSTTMYVVGVGIYGNRLSVIRRCIINSRKSTEMWLSFANGQLAVGLAGEPSFISYTDSEPIDVKYLGMATGWASSGFWQIAELDSKTIGSNFLLSEFTSYVSLTTTTDDYVYIDNKLVSERLEFYIQASSDVIILLSPTKDNSEVYKIVISNSVSSLSHCHSKDDCEVKETAYTQNIISSTSRRGFWLVFHRSGLVEVGEENKMPFLEWQDPYALAVTYFGYATTAGGYASIELSIVELPQTQHLIGEFKAPFDVKTTTNDFVYLDYSFGSDRRLEFYVTASSDVYISLSPFQNDTEFYQIILATGPSGISTLSHCFDKYECHVKATTITKDVLPGTRKGFWIVFDPAGQVDVGRDGLSPFLSWEDPYPLEVNYLGYATITNGNADITFNLKEAKSSNYDIKEFQNPLPFTSTSDDYTYLGYQLKDRTVEFFIKAGNDVSIALGPNRNDIEFYRITFAYGSYANCTLSHCFDKNDCHVKAWAITDDIISSTESRGFWIKFNPSGKVDVGRDGYTAFMSWEDPYPLDTNYIGYASVDGGNLAIIFDKRDFVTVYTK
ncbi:uncharacterized protein [Antedon mediterranea]|uniref:uncharacterized protein n=1 Tax=Antedon mediterranea TaxID=105859 RepID=UPI003AF58234